ncbi:uncharacterized protein K460DRAFT_144195 [Cucurbitaria berberidis CBS 394.84]|uniref:Uncharacterized protein n=1 Tax=Cucurbitaria berberidis CBS 394.84 TaxID=1168544 RepID=A0A9P4GDK1_9PLEO|nr:uncharacterized protein K460DRAFT_144195 [Cucurbitaria berberidis CBS 394.84]KAF1843371.1 hypothetical protein K460DRAFT_144195 [Cucurbitaria berberidis CBS 394.84]
MIFACRGTDRQFQIIALLVELSGIVFLQAATASSLRAHYIADGSTSPGNTERSRLLHQILSTAIRIKCLNILQDPSDCFATDAIERRCLKTTSRSAWLHLLVVSVE